MFISIVDWHQLSLGVRNTLTYLNSVCRKDNSIILNSGDNLCFLTVIFLIRNANIDMMVHSFELWILVYININDLLCFFEFLNLILLLLLNFFIQMRSWTSFGCPLFTSSLQNWLFNSNSTVFDFWIVLAKSKEALLNFIKKLTSFCYDYFRASLKISLSCSCILVQCLKDCSNFHSHFLNFQLLHVISLD
jgi:hypothetical protein